MRALALALLLALAACDTADVTYPAPGDYAEVELDALLDADPGRYNLRAAIADVEPCPENPDRLILCAAEATLVLAPSYPVPEDPALLGAFVPVDAPDQFRVGRRGTFSLELYRSPTGAAPTFTLLGYALD